MCEDHKLFPIIILSFIVAIVILEICIVLHFSVYFSIQNVLLNVENGIKVIKCKQIY